MIGARWSAALVAIGLAVGAAQAEHYFVLKKDQNAGALVAIERVAIGDGETKVVACGSDTGNIDVIMPVGTGQSGSVLRKGDVVAITIRNEGGLLSVTSRAANGKEWSRPARSLAELRTQHIRVSVTQHHGKGRSFLIAGYETVQDEPVGPIIDMFAGQIPLQSGDYVICTDTYLPFSEPRTYGEIALVHDRHLFIHGKLADGRAGDFILDLGAGQSVISRDFLPPGTKIEESNMVQYSAAGRELLKFEPGGATGKTQSVQGIATLDTLTFDGTVFSDVQLAVLPQMPVLSGRPAVGIIGLDLLRRAEVIALEFGGDKGKVVLSREVRGTDEAWMTIPITTFQSHLGMRADVNGVSVAFIVDTGAPVVFLDEFAARKAGVTIDASSARDVHGLDQGSARATRGTVSELRLGTARLSDQTAFVGALPVFAPLRSHDQPVGLLGNSVLGQFAFIEFDLARNVARFWQK